MYNNLLTFIPDKQLNKHKVVHIFFSNFRFQINVEMGGENYIVFVTAGIVEMLNSSGRFIELVIISRDVILTVIYVSVLS